MSIQTARISASSYSNTAPLIWSFLYGKNHGKVEIILDNSPARSADLLARDRVDAALVPVFAYQTIESVRLVPDVCVGARKRVRSVRLITKGQELKDVRNVALDNSSKTSVALTKIIFREFLGFEPEWLSSDPDLDEMLSTSDCALLIGDPSLETYETESNRTGLRSFDLAELWNGFTGLGFVFAMWMTKKEFSPIDFAAARDEGLAHIDEIISNYESEIGLDREQMRRYLTYNISYSVDPSMQAGLELYFDLAHKHGLVHEKRPLQFVSPSI